MMKVVNPSGGKTMVKVLRLLGVVAAMTSGVEAAQKPITSDFVCQHPPYTVSIVSKSPMVLYLHDFITAEERIHLQDITYALTCRLRSTPVDHELAVLLTIS